MKNELFKEKTAVRDLQTQNQELANKLNQLTAKISGLEKEVTELKKHKPSIHALIDNYAKQSELSSQEIETLQNQLTEEAEKRNTLLKDREDEIVLITSELSTARSEIDRLKIHSTSLENNAIDLAAEIDKVHREYKALLKKMPSDDEQQQQKPAPHPQPRQQPQQQQLQQPTQQLPVMQYQSPPPLAPIFQQGMGQPYMLNQLPPQIGPTQQQYQQWALTNTMIERLGDISSGQDRKEIPN